MAELSTGKPMSVTLSIRIMESVRGFGYAALYLCLILNVAYIQAVDNKTINCSRGNKETQIIQLNQSYGMLQTPNYPGRYFRNQHILWQIKPPHKGPLTVRIHGFELEGHESCFYDHMTILDSRNCAVLFGPTCGVIEPQILNLNSTSVLIEFSSDVSNEYRGFLITFWISLPLGTAITYTVQGNEGIFMSPLYESAFGYPIDVTVMWSLKVPFGMIIILNFMDFRLESSGLQCKNDYLAVRDGPYSNSPLLGKYCGIQQAFALCSKTSSLTLELASDSTNTERGFRAHFNSERPENFQIVGKITKLITPIGTFNATTPIYKTSVFDIYIWQIHVPIENKIQLQWTFVGNETKPSFFVINEVSVNNHSATYLEIDVNVLKQVKVLHPLWLRNLLSSTSSALISSGKQWKSSGNIILVALGSMQRRALSFSGEYRMTQEDSHIGDRCVGPFHELSMVNKSTIFPMQLLYKQGGSSAMVRCKWTFKSKFHHSIKMEVLSIYNNFGNTETCDNGGIIFYEKSTNNSKRYGPYCRVTDRQAIPQIYTPTVSVFVSESPTLSVMLYGYSGMDIKVRISQSNCQGIVPQSKHDSELNGMNYNWTLGFNSQPICYHVNGFALPISYNLTFNIPDASALYLLIHRNESEVKENCHNQLMITGCNISTTLVPQMTSLKLPCNSHMPKSIQVRSINTCPMTKSYWYIQLINSKLNVGCQLQHPNCTDEIDRVCGKILIPLSDLSSDNKIISDKCFIQIHSFHKEHPFGSMTYYELTFQAYNLKGCKRKEVRVEESVVRSNWIGLYGSSSVINHTFSACDLKDRYKIIRTMTTDGVKISVHKSSRKASNKGDIYVKFRTLIHPFHQLPNLDQLCPQGFRYMKKQCYLYQEPDMQNKKVGYKGTWMDANLVCKNLNASLLSITNEEEMITIKELMSSVWAKAMFNYPAIYVYIGLLDNIKVSIHWFQKVMTSIQLKVNLN